MLATEAGSTEKTGPIYLSATQQGGHAPWGSVIVFKTSSQKWASALFCVKCSLAGTQRFEPGNESEADMTAGSVLAATARVAVILKAAAGRAIA